MVSFGIITISYKRTKVLQLFLASIKRLRREVGMFPCVVVGDEEHKNLCGQYDVTHITQANHPATAKFNTGVAYMMFLGVDYVVVMGSDDIMSTDLLKNLIREMENGYDLIGISQLYFYAGDGKYRGKLRHLVTHGQYLGVARCIHRRIIGKVSPLWNAERSWGMDGIALRNIAPHIKTKKLVEGICTDVKTEENLNKFHFWTTRIDMNTPPKVFYDTLGEEEKVILSEI
jgi:hypothetical protein